MNFTQEQQQAITITGTACVTANAGAGKTAVLVERIVRQVIAGIPVGSILAITFTEKAALEIKTRLIEAMKKSGLPYWDVETAYISTFHGFCSRLIREQALSLGRNPSGQILTEPEAQTLLRRALRETERSPELSEAYEPSTIEAAVPVLIAKLAAVGVTKYGELLSTEAEQQALIEKIVQTIIPQKVLKIKKILTVLLGYDLGKKTTEFVRIKEIADTCTTYADWQTMANCFDEITLTGLPKTLEKDEREAIKKLRDKIKATVGTGFKPVPTVADGKLLFLFADQVRERYQSLKSDRFFDFNDLELQALSILKNNPAIVAAYRNKFQQVLVDEFQDTNYLQNDIVQLVARPDNLYIVGDWKQSIYRFRNAEVRLLQSYATTAPTITLPHNFRSKTEILDAVNQTCGNLFATYEPLLPGKAEIGGRVWIARQQDESPAEQLRWNEAGYIAEKIKNARAEGRSYRDIAILFRRRTGLKIYEEVLRQEGIPFVTVGGSGYYQRQEVADVIHYLTILIEPENDIAAVGALRSPLIGLSDESIFLLAQRKSTTILSAYVPSIIEQSSLSPEEKRKALRVYRDLTNLRQLIGKLSIVEIIQRVIDTTQIAEYLFSIGEDPSPMYKLIEIAKAFRLSVRLADFINYLQEIQDWEVREEEIVRGDDAVTLMTIHGAKGLEFPLVIVTEIDQPRATAGDVLFSAPWFREYGLPPGLKGTVIYDLIAVQDREEAQAEAQRLLYVAMTRAKDQLIVCIREPKEPDLESLSWSDWFSGLLKEQKLTTVVLEEIKNKKIETKKENKNNIWKKESTAIERYIHDKSELMMSRLSATQVAELVTDKERFMKKYFLGRKTLPNIHGGESSDRIGNAVHGCISDNRRELPPSLTPDETAYASRCLCHWFDSDVYNKVLSAEHYFELPFEYVYDGFYYDGRIDCLFKDGEEWHILEFKTAVKTPENLKEYSAQVSVYVAALHHARMPVKASIVYLSEPETVLVDPDMNILAKIGHLLVVKGGEYGCSGGSLESSPCTEG
jgi:ATP-dependent helicase/nuclease subunit A